MIDFFEYLKFISKSSNHHGVHSPFIYKLITKCFYSKTKPNLWNIFLKTKRQLLDNKTIIKVTDFGSGSKVFKTNHRSVSKITKVAGISNKKAKLLLRLIDYFKPKSVLEIGTSVGLATSAIKISHKNAKITSLEGCSETSNIAYNFLISNNFKNINIITGDFKDTLVKATKNQQFDFIYFDGNHTKKDTLKYFNVCLTTTHNDSIWVFDDIYWNKEMKEAWAKIKLCPKVTVTVDIFYWGIVFFRKEQAKEDFKIRV